MTRKVRYEQLVEAVLPGVQAWGEDGREDVARWCVDAILSALAQPVEVTDEMVERAAQAWNDEGTAGSQGTRWTQLTEHERGYWRCVARAALRAALEAEPQTERKKTRDRP